MPMCNLIECSDYYSKILISLWEYCSNEPAINNDNGNIFEFNEANATTNLLNLKKKTGKLGNNGARYVETMVPLKHLSKFWRTLEMSLMNCKINLILTWSVECVILSSSNLSQAATFATTNRYFYIPVVTLSTKDNAKIT